MANKAWLITGCLLLGTIAVKAGAGEVGKQNYMLRCAGCHLADGSGSPQQGIPDLRNNAMLFLHSKNGRNFLLQVPGVAHTPLSNQEVANVMNWMLHAVSPHEIAVDFVPYTAAEVAVARDNQPADVMRLRANVVQELNVLGIAVK